MIACNPPGDGLTRSGCFAGHYYTGVEKNRSYFYPSSPDPDLARIPRQSNPARSPPGHFSKKIDLDILCFLTSAMTSIKFHIFQRFFQFFNYITLKLLNYFISSLFFTYIFFTLFCAFSIRLIKVLPFGGGLFSLVAHISKFG